MVRTRKYAVYDRPASWIVALLMGGLLVASTAGSPAPQSVRPGVGALGRAGFYVARVLLSVVVGLFAGYLIDTLPS